MVTCPVSGAMSQKNEQAGNCADAATQKKVMPDGAEKALGRLTLTVLCDIEKLLAGRGTGIPPKKGRSHRE